MRESASRLLLDLLAQSWRAAPPCLTQRLPLSQSATELDAELTALVGALQGAGVAALVWRRLAQTPWREREAAEALRQAYRLQVLRAARDELHIQEVFARLRDGGVEPLLVKGWAIARLYPEKGLRPYGDIDLLVRPPERRRAAAILQGEAAKQYAVDLDHKEPAKMGGATMEALFERSQLMQLGETEVRVLSEEDHLRFLCLHLLRHGAWRPLWLCDIAVAVEGRGAAFDWQLCLTENRRQADWIRCTVRLAQELLGAEIAETPAEHHPLPDWLLPTVLKQWQRPSAADHPLPASIRLSLKQPSRLPAALRERWLDPISASVSVNAPFNNLPRLPFQLASLLALAGNFFSQGVGSRE